LGRTGSVLFETGANWGETRGGSDVEQVRIG
jgi:hypothetical protein